MSSFRGGLITGGCSYTYMYDIILGSSAALRTALINSIQCMKYSVHSEHSAYLVTVMQCVHCKDSLPLSKITHHTQCGHCLQRKRHLRSKHSSQSIRCMSRTDCMHVLHTFSTEYTYAADNVYTVCNVPTAYIGYSVYIVACSVCTQHAVHIASIS